MLSLVDLVLAELASFDTERLLDIERNSHEIFNFLVQFQDAFAHLNLQMLAFLKLHLQIFSCLFIVTLRSIDFFFQIEGQFVFDFLVHGVQDVDVLGNLSELFFQTFYFHFLQLSLFPEFFIFFNEGRALVQVSPRVWLSDHFFELSFAQILLFKDFIFLLNDAQLALQIVYLVLLRVIKVLLTSGSLIVLFSNDFQFRNVQL